MPDFDFDAYNHDDVEGLEGENDEIVAEAEAEVPAASNSANTATSSAEEVDKW